MPVEWLEDPRAFIERDWTRLVEADPEASFFHTPAFLKLYWEEFGAERLQLAFVTRGEETTAVAAFDLRRGILTWLGGFDVTDYMGPVGPPDDRAWSAAELMGAIAERSDWTKGDLSGQRLRGHWLTDLTTAAEEVGLATAVEPVDVAPYLRLPGSYEDYLKGLESKLRHEMRRKERRLRETHPDVKLVDAAPETATEDLDRFMELHRSSRGEKGRFMVPGMELFFRRLAAEHLADGTFRIAFLETEGLKIAAAAGFRWRDRFLLYNSAYDHAYAHVAPGMVLIGELIKSSIEEGRRGFDMLKGDLRYKYRFGARPIGIERIRLRPRRTT